ncbi:unnamed protein product, partial [Pelagomonas calceolata]
PILLLLALVPQNFKKFGSSRTRPGFESPLRNFFCCFFGPRRHLLTTGGFGGHGTGSRTRWPRNRHEHSVRACLGYLRAPNWQASISNATRRLTSLSALLRFSRRRSRHGPRATSPLARR